jgi:cell division protein FtsB
MAVYQGARRRTALPLGLDALGPSRDRHGRAARADDIPAPRPQARTARATHAAGSRRTAAAGRRRTRPSSIGVALAAIVIVFSAAFLSLSQSVRVAATGYDIVRLVSEHDRLEAIRQDLTSDVERLRSEPAIRKQALDAGLGQLGAPLVIPAR